MAETATSPPVGVWDQVVAFGQYQHQTVGGEPCVSIHDASTCKVMLDDFAAHPDVDIFYDKQHEVEPLLGKDALDRDKMRAWGEGDGHALAWANALCMVLGGQVVRYEAHPGAPPTAPRSDDVLVQSDGTRRGDGVYCLRAKVTPRGADPVEGLENFRFTSPYYVPERDGNRLLNLTATNDPRMRGCALAFSRTSAPIAMSRVTQSTQPATQTRGAKDTMDPKEMARLMEAAGCKAEDKEDEKFSKMSAYARKMEDDAKKEKEASEMARKKMEDDAAEMRRQMDAADPKRAAMRKKMEEEEKKMGRKMDDSERAKFEADHKEPDGDEPGIMQAMSRKVEARDEKIAMLEKTVAELRAAVGPLAQANEAAQERNAQELAMSAIAMGRIPAMHKGDESATVAWLAKKYKEGPQVAEEFLFPEGHFKPSEPMVMQRFVQNGAPIGAPSPREGMSEDDILDAKISQELKVMKGEGIDLAKIDSFAVAMKRVAAKNPNYAAGARRPAGRL